MRHVAVITTALLVGCSTMPDVKVEGIEGLKVTEHPMSQMEVTAICGRKLGIPTAMRLLITPLACATVWLEKWTCDIYYSKATEKWTLEHERKHCQGYWHDDRLQRYFDNWKHHATNQK